MKLSLYCDLAKLNWTTVAELPSFLSRYGLRTDSISVNLRRFPEKLEFESLEHIQQYVKIKGEPGAFDIRLRGKEAEKEFSFSLSKGTNIHHEPYLVIELDAEAPEPILTAAMELLDLSPEHRTQAAELPRTVFIAHRFDAVGQEASDKIALFLTLLGFECVSGRGYAPGPISEKVKSRMQAQAVVVVVWTPGEDSTWLVQESLLSNLSGKPLILIKDATSAFRPGLLADLEFIPFSEARIEQAFIPLLEGLRAIGFMFGSTD
ncbi:MAG: hypothetical protein KGZ83_03710 [Sulfuricella sp.]|nr:hypothetical protein [Sulfuricella sp.]